MGLDVGYGESSNTAAAVQMRERVTKEATMPESFLKAITALEAMMVGDRYSDVLKQFYKDRTLEIITHMDENGVGNIIDDTDTKVGGTD